MQKMDIDSFKKYVKRQRVQHFPSSFDMIYNIFCGRGYNKKDAAFFFEHASEVVEELRRDSWERYLPEEQEFTSEMLLNLVDDDLVATQTSKEAILSFVETYPEHIYQLSLSNTQSRRSRAGKEFEAIIELIMMGAGIYIDSQGNIGKNYFVERGLGKLVDLVSPGVVEFIIDKNDVVLISAKTTLRERWQEVPEEMGRTGAKEMYLATLDTTISDEVLEALYEQNIRVTTTRSIKETNYPDTPRVLDFERLLKNCRAACDQWSNHKYTDDEKEQLRTSISRQMNDHSDHEFVLDYYNSRLSKI